MKKTVIFIGVVLLMASSVFANDVSIDASGNITTGTSNTDANLEVTGSNEDGIVSRTSGTGKAGVYGENTPSGNFGMLGDDQYGVYGESAIGKAGHFQGDVRVTGDLTVDGALNATGLDADKVDGKHASDLLDKATYDTDDDGKVNKWGL